MRLWHELLIPHLPRQQLQGQHRECAAMRGNGWGKKHSTVDYAWNYGPVVLAMYHQLIIKEMKRRGMKPDEAWTDLRYRGKYCTPYESCPRLLYTRPLYREHNGRYLEECLANLEEKGHNIRSCLSTL